MKNNILLILLLVTGIITGAQTTATDFNVNDCSGNPHHLFAELDAGKILVLSMVDPCASCIGPSVSARNVVNNFAGSNPGKVLFYITDDFGNTNCATLQSWCNTNSLSGVVTLSNTAITQLNYGVAAMPKIIVLAGTNHKIYFTQDNSLNSANLTAAINTALVETGVNDVKDRNFGLKVYPNPVNDRLNIVYTLSTYSEFEMNVYNILGDRVKTINQAAQFNGKNEISMNTESFKNGIYFLRLTTESGSQVVKFTIER